MTAVFAAISAGRAIVAVDSLVRTPPAYSPPNTVFLHCQKVYPLVPARMAVASVGNTALVRAVLGHAHEIPDIDAATELVPDILRSAHKAHRVETFDLGEGIAKRHDVLFVGISPTAGRIVGLAFDSSDDYQAQRLDPGPGASGWRGWFNPQLPDHVLRSEFPTNAESMHRVMRRTLEHYRELAPRAPAGGLCYVLELNVEGAYSLRAVGDLGIPAE